MEERLEKRSRRNNISKGETGKVIQYVGKKRLSGCLAASLKIEHAQHCLAPVLGQNQPPGTRLMRFLRPLARDKVLQVAKKRRGTYREDCELSLYEDVSGELVEKRKASSLHWMWDTCWLLRCHAAFHGKGRRKLFKTAMMWRCLCKMLNKGTPDEVCVYLWE